jgi:hypothetical protein
MAFNHTFKYLMAGKERTETRNLSASKAIRFHCLDCSGGSIVEVRECELNLCPLWPFRMGKGSRRSKKNPTTLSPGVVQEKIST